MAQNDEYYMSLALELARKAASEGDIPVGAVVTDAYGKVIGEGRNRRRIEHDPTAHAEVVALREAARTSGVWNLSGCTLYVTLEPCPMCAGALVQARISRLVFGCTDAKAGACGTLMNVAADGRLFHRIKITRGVCEQECRKILQDFFIECRQRMQGPDKNRAFSS
jgi:tRNA(adenine34) deaminase